jgi:CHAT domain-containing protein
MTLSGSDEVSRLLDGQRITASVMRRLKDEVARLIRADIHRAVKLAEATRAAAAFCDDPIGVALGHHASAMAKYVSGHTVESVELYEQAEAIYLRLGKEMEAARVARARICVLMSLSRYDEALQVADKAREVFQRHNQPILLAQLESNVGSIYHHLDQYRDALRFYDRAREIFTRHQDQMGLTDACFNSANQYTQLNEFEKALALYQEAQAGYEKLDMPLMVNQTDYSIAWLYFLRGRFQESLDLFARVRAKTSALGDNPLEALCDLDLAEVYLQLNIYEDALESARLAAEQFEQLKMDYEYAKAKMCLGIAHRHLNDFPAAEQEMREARRVFLTEGNQVYTALTNVYLCDGLIHQRAWDQAIQLCEEAKRLFTQQKLPTKAAYAELQQARMKLFMGDVDAARSLCQSALALIGEAEAPWLKYQCWHLLGNSLQQAGQEQAAYEHYLEAVEYLEAMRSSIRVDEFKCTFLRDKLRVYEDLVELCLQAGTEEKIEEAFMYAEAAKSRSVVELLATDRSIASKVQDPSVRQLHEEWKQLREELDYYYTRLNHYESRSEQRPVWLGMELQQEVREREQHLARLARRLWREDAEYASLRSAPRIGPREVCQRLAEDEVLIEYYLVNGRLKVFALSRDDVRVFNDVTTAEVTAPLLRRLKFYLDKFTLGESYIQTHLDSIERFTRQYLEKLYAALIKPIESCLEGKKIILVPHDFLHYVPFHALYDGQQYLADRHEISYCPSAGTYALCVDKAQKAAANGQVLIMGVSDDATPFIRREVAAVQFLWDDVHVFLEEEATLNKLKRYAPACRLLHLASHGVFRRDNPMFSALKLGDGWLNFYDVFNLRLQADLVTLSACETGMNEVFPGDELFGLMRGFLYAGAPSLLVSLWKVNDRSTAKFMYWFYAGLSKGLSKRAALQQAQLMVRQTYQHPYYWAPFILMGAS